MNEKNQSPLIQWQDMHQKKLIHYDDAQAPIIKALDALWHALSTVKPQAPTPFIKKFTNLFSSDKAQDVDFIKGLYIHGQVGRGKSMLMDLFYESLNREDKERVHFHDFMLRVHGWLNQWRKQSSQGQAQANTQAQDPLPLFAGDYAKKTKILCFDEFHINDIADAMILARLFSALLDEGVVVVATSNQAPDELYKDGLQRVHILPFIDILKSRLTILSLQSPQDYRRLNAKETRRFIQMSEEEAMPVLLTLMRKYTDKDHGDCYRLNHQKREIIFKQAKPTLNGGMLLNTDFQELCTRPLGAVDYLALVKIFDMILLRGLKPFHADMRNDTKRFMTFIDIAYEQKTKLILQANCDLHELTPPPSLAEGFERTISRLYEMQKDDYWNLK